MKGHIGRPHLVSHQVHFAKCALERITKWSDAAKSKIRTNLAQHFDWLEVFHLGASARNGAVLETMARSTYREASNPTLFELTSGVDLVEVQQPG